MEKPEIPVEKLVDVREMAWILKVPVSWLYERTRLGTVPCIRIGKIRPIRAGKGSYVLPKPETKGATPAMRFPLDFWQPILLPLCLC